MHNWLESGLAEQIGWLILHSIWQVCAIAAVLYLALLVLKGRSAQIRYAVSVAAMVLLLVAPALTWFTLIDDASDSTPPVTDVYVMSAPADTSPQPVTAYDIDVETESSRFTRADLTAALPWISTIWSFGVVVYLLYLGGGWYRSRRLRHDAVLQPPESTRRQWQGLAASLGIEREVHFLLSERIRVPLTMGSWQPVVLIPVSVMTGLPPQQLHAIIAHELAHIRRHDYLVNLAQGLGEALYFYHPAAWWISRQIREQREFCCDDIALHVKGPLTYSRALASLEEARASEPYNRFAMAASDGALLQRIKRILHGTYDRAVAGNTLVPASSVAIAAATLLMSVAVSGGPFLAQEKDAIENAVTDLQETAGYSHLWDANELTFGMADRLKDWRATWADTSETEPPSDEIPEPDVRSDDEIGLIPDEEVFYPYAGDPIVLDTLRSPFVTVPDSVLVKLDDVEVMIGKLPHIVLHPDSLALRMGAIFPDSLPGPIQLNVEKFRGELPVLDTTHLRFFSPEGRREFQEEMRALREKLQVASDSIRQQRDRFLEEFGPERQQLRDSLKRQAEIIRREVEASIDHGALREQVESARQQAEAVREEAYRTQRSRAATYLRESLRELQEAAGQLDDEIAGAGTAEERRELERRRDRLEMAIDVLEDRIATMYESKGGPDLEENP